MNARERFELHPGAAQDIREIWEFTAADNLLAAGCLREEIMYAIQRLLPFPHQGHRRPDLTSRPFRFISVRDYLIAYAPDEGPLLVIGVLHGRRSPRIMAAILRGRQ